MKTKKRILSLLLTMMMVLTLMPAATFTSQAKSDYPVSSIEQLKTYMESDGAYCAVLQKDLSGHADGDYAYWCVTKGSKWIDMNGHTLSISNDDSRTYSMMFRVPEGASLTVYDSQKSGKGNIHFDGRLNDDGDYRDRSIFDVQGSLELNGITVEAGRSKSFYSAKYAKTVYKQIFGWAVRANNGSRVIINSSILYGRGNNGIGTTAPSYGRNAGINALNGSTVYFNDGQIKAKGGANCFNVYSGATVKVMNGAFTCDKLDAIQCDGKITNGIGRGRVGLNAANIGKFAVVSSTNDSSSGGALDATSVKISPSGKSTGTFTAMSGDTVTENGKTVHRLLISNPKVRIATDGDFTGASTYFGNVNIGTFGVDYHKTYVMRVYRDGSLVKASDPRAQGQTTFSVYDDVVAGFNPEKGVVYKLEAQFYENLNDVYATGLTKEFYFKVVDDIEAPVINSQSPTDLYYKAGDQPTLFVSATGTNLKYVWQRKKPGEFAWTQLMSETNSTLPIGPLTAADDGTIYRAVVSNSKGNTWAEDMTLHLIQDISRVDIELDKPRHGMPLDYSATTTTTGCKIVKVEWEKVRQGKVSTGFTPYSGLRMEAIVTVEAVGGMKFSNTGVTGYIGDQKSYITSNPTENQKALHFSFDTLPPTSGSVGIDTVFLEVQEPAAGDTLHDLKIIDGGAYSSAYDRDVRCGTTGTTWYCDGVKANFSDVVQVGKTYTVETTLVPNTGWSFLVNSSAEVNGEPMEAELQGANLKVRRDFTILDDGAVEPPEDGNPFVDVSSSDYFYEPVLWAVEHGITNGTDATHFSPEATCTRGQVVTFLWRANGSPEPGSASNPFYDVSASDYYYKAVLWAVQRGITNGTSDTTFSPDQGCTRGQVVTFLNRAGGNQKADAVNPFVDVYPSDYYYDAVLWAVKWGITNGTDATHFSPDATCTRGQIVTFLYRAPKG